VQTQGEIYLPAQMVTTGWGIPPVCVRHGRPATTTRRIRFASRTPWWAYLLLLVSLLIALIVMLVVQKRLTAPAWPVCDECRRLRRVRLTAMWCLLVGGPVLGLLIAGAAGSSDPGSAASGLALVAGLVVAPLAGAFVGASGSWGSLLAAGVDPTGMSVQFRRPAAAFVQLLPGMTPASPLAPPTVPAARPAASGSTILPGR
jgi:hypothetical protein